jgi:tetratricopeptide (TPR) repeat protein
MDLSTREGRREQGQRLQQAAEAAGLSLEALARAIECSRALIYQYVSGATLAQPDKVQRIAAATAVPLSHFYDTPAEGAAPEQPEAAVAAAVSIESAEPCPEDAPTPTAAGVDEQRLRLSLASLEELARAHQSGPDLKAQVAACQRMIPLTQQLGDRAAEAEALLSLGNAQFRLGQQSEALAPLGQALGLFEEQGQTDRALACRQTLGAALTAAGQVEAARAQFRQVAEAADWNSRWKGLLSLGALEEWCGDYRAALDRLNEAESVVESGTDARLVRLGRAYVAANRVNVFLGCGDCQNALALARQSFAEAEASGNADQYVESQLNIGVCLTALGAWTEAADWLRRAEEVARLTDDEERELAARACRAESLAEAGRYDEAKPLADRKSVV